MPAWGGFLTVVQKLMTSGDELSIGATTAILTIVWTIV